MTTKSTRLHAFKLCFPTVLMSDMQILYHCFQPNNCVVTVSGLVCKTMFQTKTEKWRLASALSSHFPWWKQVVLMKGQTEDAVDRTPIIRHWVGVNICCSAHLSCIGPLKPQEWFFFHRAAPSGIILLVVSGKGLTSHSFCNDFPYATLFSGNAGL